MPSKVAASSRRKISLLEQLEARAYLNALMFSAPTAVAAGNHPQALVLADLNGDNKPDLVVANEIDDTLSVYLGKGNGKFDPDGTISVGNQPDGLMVADVNGDNKPDLIVSNYTDHTVSVLLGRGNAKFKPAITTSVPGGLTHGAEPFTLADIFGHNQLDLVTANGSNDSISVYPGNGDGTFGAPVTTSIGGIEGSAFSVAAGEFTDSGHIDLVVTNPADGVVDVLLGNGDGTFSIHSYSDAAYPSAVTVADLRGDGKEDIIVTNKYGDSDSVFLGNGDGTFALPETLSVGNLPFSSTVADVNGDGNLDIVTVNTGSSSVTGDTLSVLPGNGDGTFGAAQTLSVGNYPTAVAATDLTGDGNIDLVTTDAKDNGVSVLVNAGPVIRLASGVLSVTGTPNADTGSLTAAYGNIQVSIDGEIRSYSASSVTSIEVSLLAGPDSFSIGSDVPSVYIDGGGGADTIVAANSAGDTVMGGAGGNLLESTGIGSNYFDGGIGNDTLIAGSGNDTLYGDIGNDSILCSGVGADSIGGNTFARGGPGNDTIIAGSGLSQTLRGNGGADSIVGGDGNDFINGNAGNDTIVGSNTVDTGVDTIFGGGGNDSISGTRSADLVSYGPN
jgi:Ca2+-binding RTX toxin-like protein